MSVLYLTYIPLQTTTPRSGRASRQDLRDGSTDTSPGHLNSTESADMEKDALKSEDQSGTGLPSARNTEDWRTLRQCAQVLSLCRVRDAMGTGMQPMMGYLRYVP